MLVFKLFFPFLILWGCTWTQYEMLTQPHPETPTSLNEEKQENQENPSSVAETFFLFVQNLQFHKDFEKEYDRVLDAIFSGDLARFYSALYPTPRARIRELRFYGIPKEGAYTFYLGDHRPEKRGETQLKIQLKQENELRYVLKTSLELFLPDHPIDTLPQVLDRFYENLLQPAKQQLFQKGLHSKNDTETLWRVKHSYPYLYELIHHYVSLYSLMAPEKEIPQKVDICGTVNWVRLQHDYPKLTEWMQKFRRVMNSHITFQDEDNRILTYWNMNSRELTLRSKFAIDFDGLVPMNDRTEVGMNYGFKLQELKAYDFFADFLLDLNVLGLQIEIKNLKAHLHLTLNPQEGRLTYEFLPDCDVSVQGNLLYFLPKGMIDMLLPSNIEELIKNFIGELIREQSAQGGLVITKVENGYLWKIYSKQHLLNNGFLQIAANFVRLKFNLTPEQRSELGEMFLRIVFAFAEQPYDEMKKQYEARYGPLIPAPSTK
ncbi:MAG: hypothetical protein AABZ60_22365 [Planctomycetota bacterium]